MGFSLGGAAAAVCAAAAACLGGGDAGTSPMTLATNVTTSFTSSAGHEAPASQGTEVTIAPAPGPSI